MRRIGKLEVIAFVVGCSLLTYELVAARVLSPTIGSSTYVWTSVIGVIIAALTIGFWIGGRIADQRNRLSDIIWLLLATSFGVVMTILWYLPVLDNVAAQIGDVRLQAVVAALLLFAPTSFLIGIMSPYLAKLNVRSLATSGRRVASLSAFDSLGGIFGTFMTGFVLLSLIGSRETFVLVALLLVGISWIVMPSYRWKVRVGVTLALLVGMFLPSPSTQGVIDIDTPSAHYQVKDYTYNTNEIVGLTTGPTGIQSAVYKNGDKGLVFWYAQMMAQLVAEKKPERLLVLGGGAFTMPEYLGTTYPEMAIDVVEIDPELQSISEKYFGYTNPPNVQEIFDDARHFLETSTSQYDMVLVDVYGDSAIPFTLMTREYAAALAPRVASGGMVVANMIVGESGPCKQVFAALDAAYRTQYRFAHYVNQAGEPAPRANYIVSYSNDSQPLLGMKPLTAFDQRAYTDNFAPAEQLHYACQSV